MSGKRTRAVPPGAQVLAVNDDGVVYGQGDALVVEYMFAGKPVTTRLPADLEWLSAWLALLEAACDQVAALSDSGRRRFA